ncbi:hypothetical protein KVR01_010508 [Diaporthe batatas]|uniref:uncharacterized protein n=1 Tax=Diaporthe batatas TaxID=748121 RepID=UPI001D052DA2|nr:uncharacterized protein KVR01_010508 [Diaporthe batatas]KAG8159871.1 hypothetical protein KVR01_010508 [Diaporthe batatas]
MAELIPNGLLRPEDRRILHRIAFEGEDTAHWALFLPEAAGGVSGLLVHVGILKGKSGAKQNRQLRSEIINLSSTSAQCAFPIANTYVSEYQLMRAAQTVFDRKEYRTLTNNCQHFCIDVITELNQIWPECVTAQAVKDVATRGTIFTKTTRFLKMDRLIEARNKWKSRTKQAPSPVPRTFTRISIK